MAGKSLYLSEIFFSIQGESSYSGLPFIFIRLAGCNLKCSYCDTAYASDNGEEKRLSAILETISKFPCKNVEVTGGEPLLQESSIDLMEMLVKKGYRVLLETNGSVDISPVPARVVRIVDIKCPGSGQEQSFDLNNIDRLKNTDEVKFVLSSRADYDYARRIIEDYDIGKKCGIIMSGAYNVLPLKNIAGWVLEDGLDVRLQIQLHKHIFGDFRSV